MDLQRKLIAELLGTLWLVLGGCGSAVLAANFRTRTPASGSSVSRSPSA
jgi:glycerol uptake facilitator-like aquaporin